MTSFVYTTKPSWLMSHQGLLDITQHHMFVPKALGEFTTLSDSTGFIKGLKQFLYWKGQLLPSCSKNTIFLAFLGQQGLVFKNVANVLGALRSVCNLSLLQETYSGANINFLALSFTDEGPILDIVKKFLFFDNCVVLPIVFRGDNTHRFRLLWLPPMFDVARVHHLLGQLFASHRLKRESISIGDGQFSPTNVVAGTITLKPGMTSKQLPYLIKLPSPHKGSALLYIEGRPPLCLKCREIGHTRQLCTMVRCPTCQMVHFPSSVCGVSSYSTVAAKGITIVQDDDWIAHLDEESSIVPAASSSVPNDSEAHSTKLVDNEELVTPSSSILEPSSSSVEPKESPALQKFDRTSSVLAGHTFITEDAASLSSDHSSSDLIPKGTNLEDPPLASTFPILNDDINMKSFSTHSISLESSQAPSPPLTRSRKKRLVSTSDRLGNALRSEMASFIPHSSTSTINDSSSCYGSPHFKTSMDFDHANEDQMNSSSSDTLSDVEVDLSYREVFQDVSSRKRKSTGSILPDGSSSLYGDSLGASPLLVSVPSPTSVTPDDSFDYAFPSHDIPDVSLSEEDKRVASFFSLSSSDLISIKSACPGNEFSPTIIRKLTILHKHSIRILPVINHIQFFSLSLSVITKRIKTLEHHQPTPISIPDLLQMGSSYEIIQGLPVITPTPKLCSDDPFHLNP